MQGIKISINYVGSRFDIVLITIAGYVDTTTCQELTENFKDIINRGHYLMVADLGGVSYISSAGWGVFVSEIKNIRDQGGDLKIVQMNPEVFEVFEMLEFNRILNYYESIEEAINEFDIIRGIDITNKEYSGKDKTETKTSVPIVDFNPPLAISSAHDENADHVSRTRIPAKDFPLVEKIKMIVIENPFMKTKNICRELNTEQYGFVRIKRLKMRKVLKELNLETKEKRYRFYRSR